MSPCLGFALLNLYSRFGRFPGGRGDLCDAEPEPGGDQACDDVVHLGCEVAVLFVDGEAALSYGECRSVGGPERSWVAWLPAVVR